MSGIQHCLGTRLSPKLSSHIISWISTWSLYAEVSSTLQMWKPRLRNRKSGRDRIWSLCPLMPQRLAHLCCAQPAEIHPWMCWQVKDSRDYRQPRVKEEFLPGAFRGATALLTPWFWTSSLQNCERIHFCYYKPLIFLVLGFNSPRKLI